MKKCQICNRETMNAEEHHVLPQFAGGEQGPTVFLCADCHSGIHRQALNDVARTAKKKFYFNSDNMKRARPYIDMIVAALQNVDKVKDREIKIMIKIPYQMAVMLHSYKQDMGYKNLGKFITDMLKIFIKNRMG